MSELLAALGLKPALHAQWLSDYPDTQICRVSQVHRGAINTLGADGEQILNLAPNFPALAVGDWVAVDDGQLVGLLERQTWLRRRSISTSEPQLIAANVDVVFIVCAFAETQKLQQRNLNPRRLERFLHAASEGGATAVVVLNKSDLTEDSSVQIRQLSRALNHDLVVAASAERSEVDVLRQWIAPGDTVALMGPSGVGKSSLINQLLGHAALEVGGVRGVDNKGKHTTTRRELVELPTGGLLIDTPGMRQFAVFSDEQSQASAFEDVDVLAKQCRFADCQHVSEPGCAVQSAVERGELPAERLASYHALGREALRAAARNDAYARHLQNKQYREFGKMVKSMKRLKNKES